MRLTSVNDQLRFSSYTISKAEEIALKIKVFSSTKMNLDIWFLTKTKNLIPVCSTGREWKREEGKQQWDKDV